MIQLVPEDEWDALEELCRQEIGIELPDKGTARIPAVIDDGELQAFCIAEKFLRCDNFWVSSKYRNTLKSASLIRQLANYLFQVVPVGTSAVIIAANVNQERLFKKIGFKEVPGKLFRIDV